MRRPQTKRQHRLTTKIPRVGRPRWSSSLSSRSTWSKCRKLCPATLALSEDTGFVRNYRSDPFTGYGESLNTDDRFFFPVSDAGTMQMRPFIPECRTRTYSAPNDFRYS